MKAFGLTLHRPAYTFVSLFRCLYSFYIPEDYRARTCHLTTWF